MHLFRLFLSFPLLALSVACGPRAPAEAPVESEEQDASSETAAALPLPAMTADEELLLEPLRNRVEHLSGEIGERHENAHWELADAADYLAGELEGLGLPVERQGYETRNVAAQNLAVTIPGQERGDQIFVVAAHYDSPSGDRGENAGGTATAALLSLVELMRGANLKRTLRFVFFSMGESPHGDGEARGARHYARFLTETRGKEIHSPLGEGPSLTKRAETVGILHLDRLASFDPRDETAAPLQLNLQFSPESGTIRGLFLEDIERDVVHVSEVPWTADGDSDLLAFSQAGIAGVSVSGTAADTDSVQYEQLARVVMQLRRSIGRICGEKLANDRILTPLLQ